jgi:hypothetical protein
MIRDSKSFVKEENKYDLIEKYFQETQKKKVSDFVDSVASVDNSDSHEKPQLQSNIQKDS